MGLIRAAEYPSISVVIPVLNDEMYLERSISSALQQTRAATEVLVSDNHSSDGSRAVATSFGSDVRVIMPPTRLRMFEHFNFAVKRSIGDFVVVLSSDDSLEPHFVRRLGSIAIHRDAVVVRGGVSYVTDGDLRVATSRLLTIPRVEAWPSALSRQLAGPRVALPAAIFSRRAFDAVGGFDEEYELAGDWALWLSLSTIGSFYRTRSLVARYRSQYRPDVDARRAVAFFRDFLRIYTVTLPTLLAKQATPFPTVMKTNAIEEFLASQICNWHGRITSTELEECLNLSEAILDQLQLDPSLFWSRIAERTA